MRDGGRRRRALVFVRQEAERDDKRAFVRATKDGWSPEELKKLGLESGAARRRRKTSSRATSDSAAVSTEEESHGAQ